MRRTLFASLSTLLAAAVLVIACGGNKPPEANTPPNGSADAVGSATPPPAPSTTTTTTMTLGDGGDLTGAKLATSSTSTVTTGDTKPDGGAKAFGPEPGRSVKDIQAIILSHRDEARACYDAELKANPGIEGNVDMKWKIDPKGNATEVGMDEGTSTIHDDKVWKCIAGVIQKIKFAESVKGFETRTHYPFNFHPKQSVGGARDTGNP